jgi:hypothetical protein
MKKTYTELIYRSDCAKFAIHELEEDKYSFKFNAGSAEKTAVELSMTEILDFYNFVEEFIKESMNNTMSLTEILNKYDPPELATHFKNDPRMTGTRQHDARFAPDPDGVFNK